MRIGALYIRVSTDDQVEYSPEAQIRLGLEYAKKNNIIIPKELIFQDDGISGRKAANRPDFQKMITLAKSEKHPFDVIIVWKFSRFARNQEESIVYKNLLRKSNVDVVSISEPIPDGFIGELVQRIFEWMDEYYSINLSQEVLRGMTQRAMKGQYNSAPPLGYKMEEGIPIVIPEQAEIVKKIFHMYVNEQLSFFDIAKKLNTFGYETKRGGKFQNRTVAYIIRNEFYIGKIVWNNIKQQGDYETFISEKLFNEAQSMDRAASKRGRRRPSSTYKHWLSGMLICSSCGGRLVRSYTNKNGLSSFQCTAYNHGACTTSHMISESKLTPAILDGLKKVIDGGNISYTINHTETDRNDSEHKLLLKRINNLKAKEERIKKAYRDGIDTLEEYKLNKEILTKEKETLIELLEKCPEFKSSEENNNLLISSIKSAYDIICAPNSTEMQKHEALRSVVDKIIYDKKNNALSLYFYVHD